LLLLTAVDAHTGESVVFDRHSGVDLVDGGYRLNAENADLAVGYERVLVLSPLGGRTVYPPHWGTEVATRGTASEGRQCSLRPFSCAIVSTQTFPDWYRGPRCAALRRLCACQVSFSAKVASACTSDFPSCSTSASQMVSLSPRLRTVAVTVSGPGLPGRR
jgi:hypothetical protein